MTQNRLPIISEGQVYYNEAVNEYLVVTKNRFGQIFASGKGFKCQMELESFLERYQPVNPADLSSDEKTLLLSFCNPNIELSIGHVLEDGDDIEDDSEE